MGEQFVVETAQELHGSWILRRDCERPADFVSPGKGPGLIGFCKMTQGTVFEPGTEMTEGVLVGDEIDAEFAAAGVELQDFFARDGAPRFPDLFVLRISEGMFGVELKFVDLEVGEFIDETEQGFEAGDASARNIQHDTATRKIGIITNFQARQSAAKFAEQLTQGGDRCAQAVLGEIVAFAVRYG